MFSEKKLFNLKNNLTVRFISKDSYMIRNESILNYHKVEFIAKNSITIINSKRNNLVLMFQSTRYIVNGNNKAEST